MYREGFFITSFFEMLLAPVHCKMFSDQNFMSVVVDSL